MESRGRLIPMFRRTAAQPLDDDSVIDEAPSPDSSATEEANASQAASEWPLDQRAAVQPVDLDSSGREEAAEASPVTPEWGLVQRILFRVAFAYILLYHFPFPLSYVPYVKLIHKPYQAFMDVIVLWTGKYVFQTEIQIIRPIGSGDTTYDYVRVFCLAALAVMVALVWTLLGRKRRNEVRLHEWLRVYVRFALAAAMLAYGAAKVLPSQFAVTPALDALLQPFGEFSPMGLLWSFMAASLSYTVFCGLAEMISGLFLTVRRTTLLGALVCIVVMSNVVMLNFSYDVPVKLHSSHLLLLAVFLILPDLRRLANVLVLNRPAEPAKAEPLFQGKWLRRSAVILCAVFAAALTIRELYTSYGYAKEYGYFSPEPPLYGIWEVDEMVVDGQVRPPLLTEKDRWRRVVFDYYESFSIQLTDDSWHSFVLQLDDKKKTLALTNYKDETWKSAFSYTEPGPGLLTMEGTMDGKKVQVRLHRLDPSKFLLVSRGFHWINERPFNR